MRKSKERWIGWVVLLVLGVGAGLGQDRAAIQKDIDLLTREGRGSDAGRTAWDWLTQAGPDALLPILGAMSEKDTVASNWLRTVFDRIVDHERQAGGKRLDADMLVRFAKDAGKVGRARRLALELAEELRPGTGAALYPGWLDDPEFRYEAVTLVLQQARDLAKRDEAKDKVAAAFRQAFEAARDQQQVRDAAAGLRTVGIEVSVAEQMGFLTDWYVIGPFDGTGMKGFHREYLPERRVDLKEELQGQGRVVRWKHYKITEPSPTSGGRHQALVNLREKAALGDADDAVGYAYTEFEVNRPQEVEFRGAADDNLTVWVNGKKEFAFEEWRNGVRLDRHRFKVTLAAGKNTVLVKVCQTPAPNPEPNWEFFLRLVDASGKGVPMKTLLRP
jgi:hypothetical protein